MAAALPLVSLSEVQQFLELADGEDPDLLQQLTASATNLLERLCDRQRYPFSDPQTARTDVLDGTGSTILLLPYPIKTLTTLKLGHNASAPVETIAVSDPAVIVWGAGSRVIERVDGGVFGSLDKPRYVHATYDTDDDRPDDAKLAVMRVVAQVYRARGSEDAASQNVSGFSQTMAHLAAADPLWTECVRAYKRGVFR